jgi:hypothetical protein
MQDVTIPMYLNRLHRLIKKVQEPQTLRLPDLQIQTIGQVIRKHKVPPGRIITVKIIPGLQQAAIAGHAW